MAGDPFPTALAKAVCSHFDIVAGAIVTLIYPLISSIKAIESNDKLHYQQWLTYWIIYSFVTLVELSLWSFFYWIPFWGTIKHGVRPVPQMPRPMGTHSTSTSTNIDKPSHRMY
ncbi:hypothetical protein GOP47_0020680 [Adiantum capillus-veneris]|uniref:HVA22-like protein n=1 Tax=Adiantum capillus-veneris TaxID=13818 RepID=A0A9D4U9V0_ADICA|nr:hypothetical protein GOP47_0020680 [Adiantum capillus-veneris]